MKPARTRRRSKAARAYDERGPSPYTLRKRAAALAEVIKLYPQEVALGLAKRDEAGWLFGQLYLIGAIDAEQYDAAKRLDTVVRQYRHMMHRHGMIESRSLDMMMTGTFGIQTEDLSDTAIKECEKACNVYMVAYNRLGKCGLDIRRIVLQALEDGVPTDLYKLRKGLDGLIKHR